MNIFDKALNAIGLEKKSAGVPLSSGISQTALAIFSSGSKVSAAKAMLAYNSWTYACVRAISEEIAKTHFRLYKVIKKGENVEYKELFEHEILDLLDAVNPFQTGYDLKYNTGSHLELAGNSYWLLDGVEKEGDKPKAIYILPPQYVKIIKAPLPEFIRGYVYRINGKETTYKPYQILHLKYPNPNDQYEGLGTVQAIAEWIDADNSALAVNAGYFKNGARLGGLLESETAITEGQMKVMRASFEALYKGAENSYKVGVLPKGVKYKEASTSPKDMDFATLTDKMRDKILAGFRVPKTILGTAESETNRATAETANYIFAERTIKPKLELLVQYLNEFLVPRFGEDLVLDFDSPVPEDKEAKLKEMTAALGTGQAAISVNEARARYFDLPPISNGDDVLTTFNAIPLGKPEAKSMNEQVVKTLRTPSTRGSKNKTARKKMSDEIAEKVAKGLVEFKQKQIEVKEKAIKNIKELSDDDYEIIYKAFFTRVTPYEKQVREAIRKVNEKQKEDVLKNLPKEVKSYQKALFDKRKYIGIMIDALRPIFTELYGKEGNQASAFIGTEFTMTPEVRNAIERSSELMADSYNTTTLDQIKAIITIGQDEGLSQDELSDKISQIYDLADGYRAERVARTETFRIANEATKEAWKQSGVVKTIKWYTSVDERVCEWCGPQNGKTIGISENFYSLGDSVEGDNGELLKVDYDNVGNPPLHVNCRCYIRPEEISID